MILKSSLLTGNTRLNQVAAGGVSIKAVPPPDDVDAVRRIQKALVTLGFKLPRSFPNGPSNEPDGKFGDETFRAVVAFQKSVFATDPSQWDGRVGKFTLEKMDLALSGIGFGPIPLVVSPKLLTVKFWMNAFIPRTIPGMTKDLLGGPNRGQTVLEYLGLFHTDQRSFSNHVAASSRIHLEFEVNTITKNFTSIRWCTCGVTKKYDNLITGKIEKTATATPKWAIDLNSTTPIVVKFFAAAGNPCAPPGAPDIDFKGTVSIDPTTGTLDLDCLVDDFPYFEAYATMNGGAGFKVFNAPPLAGKTPGNLFGDAKRKIITQVSDSNRDCVYDTQRIMPGTMGSVS